MVFLYNILKIKCEEMKLTNQSVRFQIFVPEVHDVDFKLMEKHLKGTILILIFFSFYNFI